MKIKAKRSGFVKAAIPAALVSMALLVPASSAQAATLHNNTWCNSGATGPGYIVASGKMCTFWPLTVQSGYAFWDITKSGSGNVCLSVGNYQGKNFVTVAGAPWRCVPVHSIHDGTSSGGLGLTVQNYFGAAYGQIAILNYSSATIRTKPGGGMQVRYYQ